MSSDQTRHRILRVSRIPPILLQDKQSERDASVAPSDSVSAVKFDNVSERSSEIYSANSSKNKQNKSFSSVALSVAEIQEEEQTRFKPVPASGTLSSEITELASSLVPEQAPATIDDGQSSKYLSLYDPGVLQFGAAAEWKQHLGETEGAPKEQSEAPEPAVRPISDLASQRISKRTLHKGTPNVHANTAPSVNESVEHKDGLDPTHESAWALDVSAFSTESTPPHLMDDLLATIYDGTPSAAPCQEVGRYFGIVGFVRFTAGYYMVLISKRSVVSLIGGHYIYHCDETQVMPVCHSSTLQSVLGRTKARDIREASLLKSFRQVDLSKNFYFSYTYDVTRTLQENMTGPRVNAEQFDICAWGYKEKFMWNYRLLKPAFDDCRDAKSVDALHAKRQWIIPLVHGFVDQAKLNVLGSAIYVSLIARRSRHFAGARFYKRGIDANGYVANDVETEQIVNKPVTSPFFAPPSRFDETASLRASPNFASYVMMRGSIPVFWTQETTNMSPRPPIEISVVDPYYTPATRHFRELFSAYGTPVIVLNLIKSKEKQPRESKLLQAYTECVEHLNSFLPESHDSTDKRIRYVAWDMSKASKSRHENVIAFLEEFAEESLQATEYFHSGPLPEPFYRTTDPSNNPILLQHGIVRVNCVDCLDRTNAAQFVLGKAALAHQLHALGLLKHPKLSFDSDAVNMLTEMYHDLGDTIAFQYGGSALAHTTDTYRKINHWTSHSRDMLEGIRRYYANSFSDADKQASIDLFLGQKPSDPGATASSCASADEASMRMAAYVDAGERMDAKLQYLQRFANSDRGFWEGYYRPFLFTDLQRLHAYKMTAVHLTRNAPDDPMPTLNEEKSSSLERTVHSPRSLLRRSILGGVRRWMTINPRTAAATHSEDSEHPAAQHAPVACEAAKSHPVSASEPFSNALEAVVHRTLHPVISLQEAREYHAYYTQFQAAQFRLADRATSTDWHVYEHTINMAYGDVRCLAHTTPDIVDAAYTAFANYLSDPPRFRSALPA